MCNNFLDFIAGDLINCCNNCLDFITGNLVGCYQV
jgi:hypothetical protein